LAGARSIPAAGRAARMLRVGDPLAVAGARRQWGSGGVTARSSAGTGAVRSRRRGLGCRASLDDRRLARRYLGFS